MPPVRAPPPARCPTSPQLPTVKPLPKTLSPSLASSPKLACGLAESALCGVDRLQERWDNYLRGLSFPQLAEEPRIAFVAEVDGEAVGYIAGHFSKPHGTEGELQSIHILPEFHGRGIGTELLHLLAEWFVSQGRRRICVGIDPNNPYQGFYVKHRATYINEHWLVWDDVGLLPGRNVGP